MKILLSSCAALVLLGSIGCEMHPLPQTIEERKQTHEQNAEQTAEQNKSFEPEAANPNAPTYFKNN